MSDTGIIVTYSGADALLDSTAFSHLIGTFSHHLPLRNLHWKPSASYVSANGSPNSPFDSSLPHPTSIRTIQSLGVRLEPIADTLLRTKLKPETRHLFQRSLLERPFCHLYFVVCDDSDAYRTQIRNDIRSWLATIQGSPTLSAATVTAKGFQGVESLQHHKNASVSSLGNGSSTPRSGTPPIRPDTPSREASGDDVLSPNSSSSSSKEKLPPPSPEYLIVVVSPPDGSSLSLPITGRGSPAPSNGSGNLKSSNDAGEKSSANKTGLGRFYSSSSTNKGSVIEKVKADFNTTRRERVVHLTRLPALHADGPARSRHSDPTIFADLQTRLKECVSATFDAVVEMQGEVVKREGAKKSVPGWNYCKWMTGMECVASTFEGVGLYSEALAQYEDIEAAFLQCLEERNLPFFSSVGGTAAGDDSAPLLDTTKKNYRDLILRNEITLFDFRTYVFAKRAALLGRLGRVSQVMNETPIFLSGVGAMLQGESLPRHFLESWTFSCSIDVVEQCQAWLIARGDVSAPGMGDDHSDDEKSPSSRAMEGQLSAAFHSAKAELLDLARRQLDKIGIAVGHLPNAIPFSLSLPHGNFGKDRQLPPLPVEGKSTQTEAGDITRQELLSAIDSIEVFDLHYVSLTERVLASWISGGRKRNVLRLRCVLGSLDFFRLRYEQAYTKFTMLSESYAESHWSVIEASHLAKQLECHSQLGKPQDQSWISVVIALLETCPQMPPSASSQPGLLQDSSSRWLNPTFLYSQLREGTKSFPQEIPISKFEPISIHVNNQVAQVANNGTEDGTEITAVVENRLACTMLVDDVRLCLINGAGKELWFTSGTKELEEGKTELKFTCSSSTYPGKYVVDVSQIRLSKVIVQYQHRKAKDHFKDSTYIEVLEDGDAMSVGLELSKMVWLDQCRNCTMKIWTGRNELDKMVVRLYYKDTREPVKGLVKARLEEVLDAVKQTTLVANEERKELTLEGAPAQSALELSIPLYEYSGASDGTVSFLVEIDYWNAQVDHSKVTRKRQLQTEIRLLVGLSLGVNVQDFFRHNRLFSKFIISAGSGGILRLGAIKLECEETTEKGNLPFEITSSSKGQEVLVTPTQTASYVFGIRRGEAVHPGQVLNRNLRLSLSYQTVQEDATRIVQKHLRQVIPASQSESLSQAHKRCLERALMSYVATEVDLSIYLSQGRFQFKPRSEKKWESICRRWAGVESKSQIDAILSVVRDTLKRFREGCKDVESHPSEWRHLSLLVDVPKMNIVNAATLEVQDKSNKMIRVGQIIKVNVFIETSFHWDGTDEQHDKEDEKEAIEKRKGGKEKAIYLSVDVNCDFINWLVVGSKRSVIKVVVPPSSLSSTPAPSVNSQLEISLVAVKSGDLSLPGISIWPLADPIQITPTSHAHRDKESNALQFEEEKSRQEQIDSLTCDSYITNEAQTVLVHSALQGADRRTYWMGL